MARLLFALRDDADLLQGVAQGPGRTYLERITNLQNFESHLKYLLEISEISTAARFAHNYLNLLEGANLQITDPDINTINVQEFLLDLPVTSFFCLASLSSSEKPKVFRYQLVENDVLNTFRNIEEFIAALGTNGTTLTNEEFMEIFNSKARLEKLINGKILIHNVVDKNNTELNCWSCTAPGCKAAGISTEEYRNHIETCHNDQFTFLDPIWSDIFRYIKQRQQIPSVGEFFKPLFIGSIYISTYQDEHFTHVFIDQDKYESSKEAAEKYEREGTFTAEYEINECIQTIIIEEDTPFNELLSQLLINFQIVYNNPDDPTKLENVDFRTDVNSEYTIEYEGIEESINATDEEEFTILNSTNYQSFIDEVTERLKEANTRNDIDDLRRFILSHRISDEIRDQIINDSQTPILISFLAKHQWLPLPGYSSPFPPEEKDLRTPASLATYISKRDPAIACSTRDRCSMYFSAILDDSLPFATYDDERPDVDSPIYFCPYLDCSYGTHNPKQMSSHIGSRVHSSGHRIMAELGPFWTPQQDYTVRNNKLPVVQIIHREVPAYKCTRCGAQFLRTNDMNNHHIKKHNCVATSITDDLTTVGQVKLITRNDIINIKAEAEREARIALARPLVENPNANVIEEAQTNQEAELQTETTTHPEQQGDGQHQAVLDHEREQEEQVREEADLEDVNNILDLTNDVSNEDLINKAIEWIQVFQDEEENHSIGIPTMNVERRKRIKKDLKALYTITLIPLMEKFMPLNDDETEKQKLDGVVYKINHEIREHCIKNLILTRQQVYNRNRRNHNTLDDRQKARLEEIKKYIDATSLSSDSAKMAKTLIEMRDIRKTENPGQVELNRYYKLKEKAITLLNNRNNIFETPKTQEDIERMMEIQEDQFNRVLDWLQSRVDESSEMAWKESNKIQKMYEDNPRKTLNHYVWPKTTPNCTLTPEEFANHYGRSWADETQHYENPIEDDEWSIDKTILDNSAQRFKEFMCNEKRIKEIISSRNHLSAHGKDGISNAIFRLAKKQSAKLFALLFKAILITKHIPLSWRRTKTIMLYKKNDPSKPENWRPIGLTSTMYRIFTATLSGYILSENKLNNVFHNAQKGFIGGTNGANEHINTLNELIYFTRRNNEKAIMITIDLTNAFGNVPHELIFDTLRKKGFNEDFISIIENIYGDNTTCIEIDGTRSENIPQRRGVLQGCPLSPLLFNSCMDPLLTHLERFNKRDGITYEWKDRSYTITAQAYADDLVLVANGEESANRMIQALEEYCNKTSLTIAPHKCTAIVEGYDDPPTITINGTSIPVTFASKNITYLGAPISGSKASKISFSKEKIKTTKNKIKLVFKSPLTFSQKIHAITTYVLPYLDYTLTNSIFAIRDLAEIDSLIRGQIAHELKTSRIPKEFAHISGKFGGLGIPSLKKKADKLKLANFLSQLLSKQDHIKALAERTIEEEKVKRGILINIEDERFLSFQFGGESGTQLCQSNHERGTNCAMMRAIQAAINLDISLQNTNEGLSLSHKDDVRKPHNAKETMEIIESYIQRDLLENIRGNLTHGHSFTGTISKTSHSYRYGSPVNNGIFKFIIQSRTNTLPNKANTATWFHNTDDNCPLCGTRETLNHILNSCKRRANLYTWRHNIIAQRVADEISKEFSPTEIRQNCILRIEGLSAENQRLMPDIVAKLEDQQKYIIVEITIPYNQETRTNGIVENTLSERQMGKENKYRSLVEEIEDRTGYDVDYYTIVISSLGHVTEKTESNLISLFGKKKGKKLAEELSMSTIKGSACIFYNKPPEKFGFTTRDPWPQSAQDNSNSDSDTQMSSTRNLSTIDGGDAPMSVSNTESFAAESQSNYSEYNTEESDRNITTNTSTNSENRTQDSNQFTTSETFTYSEYNTQDLNQNTTPDASLYPEVSTQELDENTSLNMQHNQLENLPTDIISPFEREEQIYESDLEDPEELELPPNNPSIDETTDDTTYYYDPTQEASNEETDYTE